MERSVERQSTGGAAVRSTTPSGTKPAFLITIDTEGDNVWSYPHNIQTENSKWLPRFQQLCEKYALKPTYLTNYEMATCPRFQELARDALRRGTAEIGMHLHAWHSPPFGHSLTEDDYRYNPYLIEYPTPVLREKVRAMTRLLEDVFDSKPLSHRAGRWAFNGVYAQALIENGYLVDCSVTPHVSWADHMGLPTGLGGPDFQRAPEAPYFLDIDDVCSPGASPLLEVPMTVMRLSPPVVEWIRDYLPGGRLLSRFYPRISWLRPDGQNARHMAAILDRAIQERRSYVEFMLHSSEFMPGGSPNFPNQLSIDRLYAHLEELFGRTTSRFGGKTLSEFAFSCASA